MILYSFSKKIDSSFKPYSNLDFINFNRVGVFVSDDNKILYDTYSTHEKWGKRFFEYDDKGRLERIKDYSQEANESHNYLFEFEYFSESQVLCKKILLESNFTHHDELLKKPDNIEFTENYLALIPQKHNKIIDTVIIEDTSSYYKVPLIKFNDDFEHKWMFIGNSSREGIIETKDEYSITKEVFYEDGIHIVKLRKYEFDTYLKKKVLSVLKIFSNEAGKNSTEGYLGEPIKISDWYKSEILDKHTEELDLIGTEVYHYVQGKFVFLENDYVEFLIDVYEDENEKIEKGLLINKIINRSNSFKEKVSQEYILIKRTGEEVKKILSKL